MVVFFFFFWGIRCHLLWCVPPHECELGCNCPHSSCVVGHWARLSLSRCTTNQLVGVWFPKVWPRQEQGLDLPTFLAIPRENGRRNALERMVSISHFPSITFLSDLRKLHVSLENILCTSAQSLQGYGAFCLAEVKVVPILKGEYQMSQLKF